MSKQANPVRIGLFVIGAVIMICLAVVFFGSSRIFKKSYDYVLFFDSSVNGLTAGSKVILRGVPIGRVTKIRLDEGSGQQQLTIPVFIEIYPENFNIKLDDVTVQQRADYMDFLTKKGLRARLAQQSMLTGQLMIELVMVKDPHLKEFQTEYPRLYEGLPVIPTIYSPIETLLQQLEEIQFDEIANGILDIIKSVNAFMQMEEVRNLPKRLDVLLAKTEVAVTTLSKVGGQTGEVADILNRKLPETLDAVRELLNPTGQEALDMNRLMKELSGLARSMRQLTDLLYRNPQSLLSGKGAR